MLYDSLHYGDEQHKRLALDMNWVHYIVIAIAWVWFGPYLLYHFLQAPRDNTKE